MLKLSIGLLSLSALGGMTDLALFPAGAALASLSGAPLASLSGSALSPALAQEPAPQGKPAEKPSADGAAAWIKELGSPDDAVRSRARDELAKMGEAARSALEVAAKDSQDPEVRWNARKLVRRLDEAQAEPAPSPKLERHGAGERSNRLEEIRELENDELRREQPGRAFGRSFSKSVEMGPGGKVKVTIVEDVDGKPETKTYEADSMEELRRQHPGVLDEVQIGPRGRLEGIEGLEGIQEHIDRMRKELSESERGLGGFQELRRALELDLPRLLERGTLRLDEEQLRPLREALKDFGEPRREGRDEIGEPLDQDVQELPMPGREPAPHERLGVKVEALHPEVVSFLELPEGTGLLVAEVLDGTLAQSLGLRPRDVLVEIEGEPVSTPESIRKVLARMPLDAKIRVEVLRFSSGRVTVSAQRPASVRESAKDLPPAGEPKKLEGPREKK